MIEMDHFRADERVRAARSKKVELFWKRYRAAKLRCAQTNNSAESLVERNALIAEGRKRGYFVRGLDNEVA